MVVTGSLQPPGFGSFDGGSDVGRVVIGALAAIVGKVLGKNLARAGA
jgi:hypothetical protein